MEEKIKNIMEEIKDLRRKIKIIEGKTEDLPEKIFEIKKASKKANGGYKSSAPLSFKRYSWFRRLGNLSGKNKNNKIIHFERA